MKTYFIVNGPLKSLLNEHNNNIVGLLGMSGMSGLVVRSPIGTVDDTTIWSITVELGIPVLGESPLTPVRLPIPPFYSRMMAIVTTIATTIAIIIIQ